MTQYIYFVKCPGCEDEPFDFFDEAKAFAMNCLTQKPVITQMECCHNDNGFGERTGAHDLGVVWSWEEMMDDVSVDDRLTTFSKSETFGSDDYFNCDFDDDLVTSLDNVPDNFNKPVFEGITDSTRAPLDSDFVIISKHPNRNTYSFLGNNFRMTKQLDKAMPYSTKEEAEYDIQIAEEQSDVPGSSYDRYTSKQFFVTTFKDAKQLLGDLSWRNAEQVSIDGMTIESLVEEMEENEDTVECKWCDELFDKSECRYEVNLGWLCDRCQQAIKSRGETLTFREGSIDEDYSNDPKDLVELEYPSLTVTLYGEKRDVDDWDEVEHTDSHVFLVPKVEVATAIWENWITEEDVTDVEGGLDALEDDVAWEKFLETNFDALFEKYHVQILEYFKDEATKDFRERSQEDYSLGQWYDNSDAAYDEWRDSKLFDESCTKQKLFLEEFDDAETHKANLTDCPECGTVSYDMKEQYCSNCGLGL